MKAKYIIICLILFILTLGTLVLIKPVKEYEIKKELSLINSDTLGKYYYYYSLYNFSEDYTKEDFLYFIRDKNEELYKQMKNPKIKLNSKFEERNNDSIIEGFYHIGIDNIDNKGVYFLKDYLIDMTNPYNFKLDHIYALNSDSYLELGEFNYNEIIKESIGCSGKIKILLEEEGIKDPIYHELKFNGTNSIIIPNIDSSTKDKLLKKIHNIEGIKKYKIIYFPFKYIPEQNFICE